MIKMRQDLSEKFSTTSLKSPMRTAHNELSEDIVVADVAQVPN